MLRNTEAWLVLLGGCFREPDPVFGDDGETVMCVQPPCTASHQPPHTLAGTATIAATSAGPPQESVALAFQIRAIPKSALVELS